MKIPSNRSVSGIVCEHIDQIFRRERFLVASQTLTKMFLQKIIDSIKICTITECRNMKRDFERDVQNPTMTESNLSRINEYF